MTALEILERCRNGDREIRELESSIALRRDVLERCASNSPSDSNISGHLAMEADAITRTLEQRKMAYSAELCAGAWILDLLPSVEKDVMRGWYLEHKSIGRIAAELHYSASSVKRLRASGRARCRGMEMAALTGFLPEWYERMEKVGPPCPAMDRFGPIAGQK